MSIWLKRNILFLQNKNKFVKWENSLVVLVMSPTVFKVLERLVTTDGPQIPQEEGAQAYTQNMFPC